MNNAAVALRSLLEEFNLAEALESKPWFYSQRVQHLVFLCQLAGVGFGYSFAWYSKLGPTSQELTSTYYRLITEGCDEAQGTLKEEVKKKLEKVHKALGHYSDNLSDWTELLARFGYLRLVNRLSFEDSSKEVESNLPMCTPTLSYAAERVLEMYGFLKAEEAQEPKKGTLTLREIQTKLPWTVHYHRDFRASPMTHKDFAHALLHVQKAIGKLAALVKDAEHGGSEFKPEEVDPYVADLVVCALRMANTCPGHVIDLEGAVIQRIENKNGVKL